MNIAIERFEYAAFRQGWRQGVCLGGGGQNVSAASPEKVAQRGWGGGGGLRHKPSDFSDVLHENYSLSLSK